MFYTRSCLQVTFAVAEFSRVTIDTFPGTAEMFVMPVMDVGLSRKLQVEKVTMDSNRNGRRKIGEAVQSEGRGLLGCKSECK